MSANPGFESGLYMTLDQRERLVEVLASVPAIVEELAIQLTRQSRSGSSGVQIAVTKAKEFALPFDEHASEVERDLQATLVSWIRLVLEHRGLETGGSSDILGAARWLTKHVAALAQTPGAEEALDEIEYAIRRAWKVLDRPEKEPITGDLEVARGSRLNATAIERLRIQLGDEYTGLTVRRIKTMKNKGAITPVAEVPTENGLVEVYRLGEVLDAHITYPSRQRKSQE